MAIKCISNYLRLPFWLKVCFKTVLLGAFQSGISNPIMKTPLRISSVKITLKDVWKPYLPASKEMINASIDDLDVSLSPLLLSHHKMLTFKC